MRRLIGLTAAALFVLTVYLANWAIQKYGPVPVGFGLMAPAGVYFAGLAFTLRDVTHRTLGRKWVITAILVGAVLSLLVNAHFALASAVAFTASEFCDLAVYEPVRKKGWLPAVVLSNLVGLAVDSVLFLWLAFGSLEFLTGQIVGKAWMTVLAVIALAAWQATRPQTVPA